MRILFVAPFGMSRKTTVWARTLPLAVELAARAHEVAILVPPWDSPREAGTRLRHHGVNVERVEIRGGLPVTLMRMQSYIWRYRPDIVHFIKPRAYAGLCQWLTWQCRQAALDHGARVLLDADDWEQAWTPQLRTWHGTARFLAWQEEWGLRHCDGVTVASQWLMRRIRHCHPHVPMLYLPNGSDALRASPGNVNPSGAVLLWFTRFSEVRSGWMAEFWSSMLTLLPDCRLLVAGAPVVPGIDEEFRLDLATGGGSSVEWLGYVEPDQLPALYARCQCIVAPASESAANLAKCSVKLLESAKYGIPCVASDVGEQGRFGALSHIRLVEASATPLEFARAVAASLSARGAMHDPQAAPDAVPSWPVLASHLDGFYHALGKP